MALTRDLRGSILDSGRSLSRDLGVGPILDSGRLMTLRPSDDVALDSRPFDESTLDDPTTLLPHASARAPGADTRPGRKRVIARSPRSDRPRVRLRAIVMLGHVGALHDVSLLGDLLLLPAGDDIPGERKALAESLERLVHDSKSESRDLKERTGPANIGRAVLSESMLHASASSG